MKTLSEGGSVLMAARREYRYRPPPRTGRRRPAANGLTGRARAERKLGMLLDHALGRS